VAASKQVVDALKAGHRIRIEMGVSDGLSEGKKLVASIQESCNFQILWLQRLGENPVLIVWRCQSVTEAMDEHGDIPPVC
jgi:hypothetical protein